MFTRSEGIDEKKDLGPFNFVAVVCGEKKIAAAFRDAINSYGQWEAVVGGEDDCQVILPGRSKPGTELYMSGFVDGFSAAYRDDLQ